MDCRQALDLVFTAFDGRLDNAMLGTDCSVHGLVRKENASVGTSTHLHLAGQLVLMGLRVV